MQENTIRNEEVETTTFTGTQDRTRLHSDEEWRREGNNKKWRSVSVEKNRKKMAKASRKINRLKAQGKR